MIIQRWGTYGGTLLMDIIDLPIYQQIEFIPFEHYTWQVHDLEMDVAELHHGGKTSPIAQTRSGLVHFGGDMTLVMRGITDHVGRYAISNVGGNTPPRSIGYHAHFTADSPPATTKPTFTEKPPAVSAALPPIDRLKYFNAAVAHSPTGVITKAYAHHAKYRDAHATSKTWTWTDGNIESYVKSHNRANYQAAEIVRNELLAKIDARQDLLLDVDFVEVHRSNLGVTYFGDIMGTMVRSWDEVAIQQAIDAGEITISVFGQVITS